MSAAAGVPADQLLWTAVCVALALLPHVGRIPAWVLIACAAMGLIRVGLAASGRGAPARYQRVFIALLAIALVFLQYHTLNGISAGTALLALTAGLKLLETRSSRDVRAIIFIVYFLCLTALLAGESFWLLAYLIGVCLVTTATQLRLTVTRPAPDWRASLGLSARILLQAAPLAIVLWLFFPRFSGPLWSITDGGRSALSGLGDSMSPGDITELALSDEIAFRVRFDGPVPPYPERFWRGPVLHDFDGRTWRRGGDAAADSSPAFVPEGPAYRYVVSLEPYQHPWILALDRPTRSDSEGVRPNGDYMLVQSDPVSRPTDVAATSYTMGRFAQALSPAQRKGDLSLPPTGNPRTRGLAERLRREHPVDADYVRSVLEMLHTQEYYYTLTPPPLGDDSVDEFLFETRRGFCGHYASAFAVLMRETGIPAHVVTGYFGGTHNRYADYWIVRQSGAHAWDEVWIEGSGWVRVDPTASIDPRRVDRSLSNAETSSDGSGAAVGARLSWLADLRLRLDALRQAWRERILRYDPGSQQALLSRLMIPEPDAAKLVWVLAAAMSLVLGWLTWQVRRDLRPRPADSLLRAYAEFCAKLARVGLGRAAHEGAEEHAARVARLRPDLAAAVLEFGRRYNDLRFGPRPARLEVERFAADVRTFKPRGSRAS